MELSKLSVTELKRLKTRVDAEIARRDDTTRKTLLKKVQKLASEAGVSLNDLLGSKPASPARSSGSKAPKKAAGGSRGKVKPKYRNPNDANQTWTGRGRKPQWVAAWLANGKPLDGLLIS
ncbi:H-NS histone family protein [Uliginosibacterium sp. H1]|uniref:H-NS histone family protein n=1 Tax=Uliginosibacterium sp. H1 TaxID=3114757 RepID=UPI002E18C06E|nr:H-NS histone family protein [Uliginosibacterium sp. H1]